MFFYFTSKALTVSAPLSAGGQLSILNFENWGIRKKWVPGGTCHGYLPGELTIFLVKKRLKIKYGFEGSISNVDFGLF